MQRVPKQSIVVVRDGERVTPVIDQPFDFTDEEIAHIEAVNPDALSTMATVDLAAEDSKPAKPSKAKKGQEEL